MGNSGSPGQEQGWCSPVCPTAALKVYGRAEAVPIADLVWAAGAELFRMVLL